MEKISKLRGNGKYKDYHLSVIKRVSGGDHAGLEVEHLQKCIENKTYLLVCITSLSMRKHNAKIWMNHLSPQ